MAIKLNKTQATDLAALVKAAEEANSALTEFLQKLVDDWQGKFDEHSDAWKSSETGQEAQERIDNAQDWLDEIPEIIIDLDSLS